MGIYGALSTAVTGLRAQSHALENISGNIANSQTTGYKRLDTTFVDLIPDAPLKQQTPGAVMAQSRATNNLKGDIQTASTETFIALNSNGFFVVEPKVGSADGNSVFAGTNFFTRRGDFDIDKDGYLVNGAGYYLKGLPIDRSTGNISGSVPEVIQISNAFLPAKATTSINYQANLPLMPKPTGYNVNEPNSELLDATQFGGAAGTGPATITVADKEQFEEQSIYGGAITVYAPNGAPANVQLRWAKVDSVANGGTDTWALYYNSNSISTTGTDTAWTKVGADYEFEATGNMVAPPTTEVNIPNLTVNGVAVGSVDIIHGLNGIKQFADANGTTSVSTFNQNGYGAGEFQSVAITDSGRVVASYSNGQRIDLAQVATANFNGVNSLKRLDGGVFAATTESGEPIFDLSGTGILGGALESSNTDISDEFTKLIITQQAYSASTRIVTTADEMLQEALNMIR